MTTALAVEWLKKVKKQYPSYRTAIIFRYGVKEIQDVLRGLLKDDDVSWSIVDNSKISVISVEAAKGLEFEAVVAIVSQMTNNEKYVTFTRALSDLVVVRDNYSAELFDENIEDISDAEFTDSMADDAVAENVNISDQVIIYETHYNPITDDIPSDTEHDNQENDVPATEIEDIVLSQEDIRLINEFNDILHTKFDDNHSLDDMQQKIVCSLYNGNNVSCCAPSGYMKTVMLYLLANKAHIESGKQSILTSEAYLQENELVLAERLGLRGGFINGSMQEFLKDYNKRKYDVIFVPYEFFVEGDMEEFISYFQQSVSFWGIDHPEKHVELWEIIRKCSEEIQSVCFAMTKVSFGNINLNDFISFRISEIIDDSIVRKIFFTDPSLRLNWIIEHLDELYGQGIIYCNDNNSCKTICKKLRKHRVIAEAYIDVLNTQESERINYLTNSFTKGSIPIVVTTQEIGTYLSNPRIRFVIHYDSVSEKEIYLVHLSQIGKLADDPIVYDFIAE